MQAGEQECERCGVIFSRLRKKAEEEIPLPDPPEIQPPGPKPGGFGFTGVAVALLVGALAGWYVFAPHHKSAVDGPPSAIVSSPRQQQAQRNGSQAMPQQQRLPSQPRGGEGLAGQLAKAFPVSNGVELARNATVSIRTPWGSGSGFFVTANGYIVTNRHVVEFDAAKLKTMKQNADRFAADLERFQRNMEVLRHQLVRINDAEVRRQVEEELQRRQEAYEKGIAQLKEIRGQLERIARSSGSSEIKVTLIDGSEFSVQSLKMSDHDDLALLSVDCYNAPFLRPESDLHHFGQGQRVYAIGNPKGLQHTVTSGIVSGYRDFNGRKFIQTDAPINPGNSGGPLIDEQGGLLGINTMILLNTQGIGFAVPAQEIQTEFGQYMGEY